MVKSLSLARFEGWGGKFFSLSLSLSEKTAKNLCWHSQIFPCYLLTESLRA